VFPSSWNWFIFKMKDKMKQILTSLYFSIIRLERQRKFEIHLPKDEFLERLAELLESEHYNGEIKSDKFRLTPKQDFFDSYSFYDTEIIGKFTNDRIAINLEVTGKRTSFFLFVVIFCDIIFVFFELVFLFSENHILNKLGTVFIMIMIMAMLRLISMDRIDKSEKIFIGYLSCLFKPLELRIKK
jgi:hypothetical protein